MGALGAARSQIPAGAAGTLGGTGLGQTAQPVNNALGSSAMTGLDTPGLPAAPLGGNLAAPVRAPIGSTRPMTALGAAAQGAPDGLGASGVKPFGQASPLAPSRAPIGAAQTGMPGVLGTQPVVKPIQPLSPSPPPTVDE